MHYAFAAYLWIAGDARSGAEGYYAPPPGTVGAIDLRTFEQLSTPGLEGTGPCFVASPAPIDSRYVMTDLGGDEDARSRKVDALLLDAWQVGCGHRPRGDTLADLLADTLTRGADPTGVSAWRPIVPSVRRTLPIYAGGKLWTRGHTWGRDTGLLAWETGSYTERLRSLLRADYRAVYEAAQRGELNDPEHHRRVLDASSEKYRLLGPDEWKELVPADLQTTSRLRHATTISDNFNRANADPLGSSSEGWSWSEISGDMDIESNQCLVTTKGASARSRADADLSSVDQYAQAILVNINAGGASGSSLDQRPGTMARKDSTATLTFYHGRGNDVGTLNWTLFRFVDGTATQLGSTLTEAIANGTVCRTTADGSSISVGTEAVAKITQTDTAIATGLRTGLQTFQGANIADGNRARYDDFLAEDLAAAPNAAAKVRTTHLVRAL